VAAPRQRPAAPSSPREPLIHWTHTGCLLGVPGDGKTALALEVTCPSCREDALRKGASGIVRDYARPFGRRARTK
jgi:hypothetical protein